MNVSEHIATAREFLEASNREFEAGDELQASEKLWGAATHALLAVTLAEGKSCGTHREMRVAADRISEDRDDPLLGLGFGIAEKFHANFYHGFMEDFQIERDRQTVREFVKLLLPDVPMDLHETNHG